MGLVWDVFSTLKWTFHENMMPALLKAYKSPKSNLLQRWLKNKAVAKKFKNMFLSTSLWCLQERQVMALSLTVPPWDSWALKNPWEYAPAAFVCSAFLGDFLSQKAASRQSGFTHACWRCHKLVLKVFFFYRFVFKLPLQESFWFCADELLLEQSFFHFCEATAG